MRRLCVFVIYDKEKIIEEYVEPLIEELKKYSDYLIAVCNFDKIEQGLDILINNSDEIIFRENEGLDAGAYKDVIVNNISKVNIFDFDELLLSNDTFFAPIYSFEQMFDCMNKDDCDFWGITRHKDGVLHGVSFKSHLQSYFLYFKKTILHSEIFIQFWNNYLFSNDKIKTILNYEIGLNNYLVENGFIGKAYTDILGFKKEGNPYAFYPDELIEQYHIPILKKTNFNFENKFYVNTCRAVDYIEKNLDYDIRLIKKYIEKKRKSGILGNYYDFEKMEKFIENHKRIFIYGNGGWAQRLKLYFAYKKWEYCGCFVTRDNSDNECILFRKELVEKDDGIIIAQSKKESYIEIRNYIGNGCKDDQIFAPVYVE